MQTDHPDQRSTPRRHTSAAGAPSTWSTPLLSAATTTAAPTSAGIAYRPLLNTLGTCRISTSRTVPPPTAGDRPEDDRLHRADSQLERLAGSGDREQAQPGGVQHVDRAGEPTQPVG